MACVSFLFGNDYDVALEFYKKKEFNNDLFDNIRELLKIFNPLGMSFV